MMKSRRDGVSASGRGAGRRARWGPGAWGQAGGRAVGWMLVEEDCPKRGVIGVIEISGEETPDWAECVRAGGKRRSARGGRCR